MTLTSLLAPEGVGLVQGEQLLGPCHLVGDTLTGRLPGRPEFQILQGVVLPVPVTVVDRLLGQQVASEMCSHHLPVDVFPAHGQVAVTSTVWRPVRLADLLSRARVAVLPHSRRVHRAVQRVPSARLRAVTHRTWPIVVPRQFAPSASFAISAGVTVAVRRQLLPREPGKFLLKPAAVASLHIRTVHRGTDILRCRLHRPVGREGEFTWLDEDGGDTHVLVGT